MIALGLEYDGSVFRGWQRQKDLPSVQETVEQALSKVADQDIRVVAAGRTDAGVHATGQVIHFETGILREERAWVFGGNAYLPPAVRILWARHVTADFHARYRATSRRYRYIIYNHPIRPSLLRDRVTWYCKKLSIEPMQEASAFLIGQHDFSSFRDQQCQSLSTIRNVTCLEIKQVAEFVIIDIEANAFLHHMVRNIAGVLMSVGSGELEGNEVKRILDAKDRREAKVTAAASGLYLVKVCYPVEYNIPDCITDGASYIPTYPPPYHPSF